MSTSYYQYTNGLDRARGISTVLNRESRTVDHTVNDLVLHGLLSQPGFSGSIAIFRGLKYATIAQRWHQSVLVDFASQEGDMDATQWGPRSPQTVDVMHHATSHLYPRMSTYDTMSEFECLNLNIYSPAAALEAVAGHRQADANLPVIVWIHGGSFEWGDGSCECGKHILIGGRASRGRATDAYQTASISSVMLWESVCLLSWLQSIIDLALWDSSLARNFARKHVRGARLDTAT